MEYVVVSFRSRVHTVKFYQILKNGGVRCEIINTPKEAGVGCGLSVKFGKERFIFVKKVLLNANLSTFAGFFLVKIMGNQRIVKSI